MISPAETEPAVRDPKKLRRTAWTLVGVMILGGGLVYKAYETWAKRQNADTRPAHIHQIRKERDLRVMRQDGKTADLFELRGKVWVVNVIALSQPERSQRTMEVMHRLAEKYAANPEFALVSLVVDPPPAGELVATLASQAQALRMELPHWWLAANEAPTTHKFIKSELKAGIFPHQANGEWIYDASIVLIDREGHLRRAVVPSRGGGAPYVTGFDFDQAARWDAEGRLTGNERSNVQQLEHLLTETIETLLSEDPQFR